MEYIALTLLALVLIVGTLLFLAFTSFREAARQSLSMQRQLQDQIEALARKLDRMEKSGAPKDTSASAS